MPSRAVRTAAQYFAVVLVCIAAAGLGLPEPYQHPDTATLWLPAGIALGSLMVFGAGVLPLLVVGGFLAGVMSGLSPVSALGVTTANLLGALAGMGLVRQFGRGVRAFERPRHVALFTGVVLCISAPLVAAMSVTVLVATRTVPDVLAGDVYLSWWLGAGAADLVIAPLVMLCALRPHLVLPRRRGERRPQVRGVQTLVQPRALEAWALFASVVLACLMMFDGSTPLGRSAFPLTVGAFPILVWVALRFSARETAAVLACFAGAAVWGALHGRGPFLGGAADPSLRLVPLFLAATSVTGLATASAVDERNRLDSELHLLAVTDPLTGLANYRHLTSSIEREIRHAARTLQPFSVLLLDVDNLKTINDRLGHNVGSRLLVRLADALRTSCRVTDLIARYGGDEFAVLLPRCDEDAARQQAQRVHEVLRADTDTPPIFVSLGIAVYPRDGETCDELLDSADHELYTMKGRSKKRSEVYPGEPERPPA